MYKDFDLARFELVKADRVQMDYYQFGRNKQGKLNVWIDKSDKGKRFLRQIDVEGDKSPIFTGVYTKNCHILREKTTGQFYFLDMNDAGIWLFHSDFFGSENFEASELTKIQNWVQQAL